MIKAISKKTITIYRKVTLITFFISTIVHYYLYPKIELFYLNSHIYECESSILVITTSIILSSSTAFIFYTSDLLFYKEQSNKVKRVILIFIAQAVCTFVIFMTVMSPSVTAIIPLGVNLLDDRGTVEKHLFIHNKPSLGYNKTDSSYLLLGKFQENNNIPKVDDFIITKENYENLKSKNKVTLELTKGLLGIPHSARVSKKSFKE